MLVGLVALVLGGIVWFAMRGGQKVVVVGNLSAADVAEIKHLVNAERRREFFPGFSWGNAKELPNTVSEYCRSSIVCVISSNNNVALVQVGRITRRGGYLITRFPDFSLIKGTNGWRFAPEELPLMP